jgi:hypothetical protein
MTPMPQVEGSMRRKGITPGRLLLASPLSKKVVMGKIYGKAR